MMKASNSRLGYAWRDLVTGWMCCAALACGSAEPEPAGAAGNPAPVTAAGSSAGSSAGQGAAGARVSAGGAGGTSPGVVVAGSGAAGIASSAAGVSGAAVAGSAAAGVGVSAGSGGAGAAPASGTGGAAAGSGTGSAGIGNAGSGGDAGASGRGGAPGGEPATPGTSACKPWPEATTQESVSATIRVSGTFDGMLKRFVGGGALGGGGQDEGQDPLFELSDGAVLKNVVIGAPAADGVHCTGSCTLQNVWWEDVGEDAATFKGQSDSQTMTVECAGARKAADKILQHNGPGKMIVRHFWADDFGKVYRSCGNCKSQFKREIVLSDIDAKGGRSTLVGINTNYGDVARFERITIHDTAMELHICDRFTGNDSGDEPTKTGSGPDATSCLYEESDITWQP
ncbi:MAG: pectate lyase [Polyangiales bacterium]